jgi:hypothetical protein
MRMRRMRENEGHFPYFLQGGVIHKKVGPSLKLKAESSKVNKG